MQLNKTVFCTFNIQSQEELLKRNQKSIAVFNEVKFFFEKKNNKTQNI